MNLLILWCFSRALCFYISDYEVDMQKRFLVYKEWNGRIYSEIQYGNFGPSIEGSLSKEKKRIELFDDELTLEQAIIMYPYEGTK